MIRFLTPHDVDDFITLRRKAIQEEPLIFGADPNKEIDRAVTLQDFKKKNDENFILGKFDKEKLIGMTGVLRDPQIKRRHQAMIWGMYVLPAFRGKGIAQNLLQKSITEIAKIKEVYKVYLTVTTRAVQAQKLYEKNGFRQFGRQQNALQWEAHFVDEIFMELKINSA